jgi:capsular exopolysaccharide synthesis family protein
MELEQIERDRAAIRSALAQPSDSGLSVVALEAIPSVQRSSELLQALDSLASKHAEYRALRHRYTEIHPRVQRLRREIAELERIGIPPLAAALQAQLGRRQAELEARLRETSHELRSIPARTIEEAQLRQQANLAETLYSSLHQRYEEARLAAASVIPDARILDHAITPRWPINAEMAPRIIALAILGAFGLSVFLVLLFDRFDPRLRHPEHVEEQLGLPVLGVVPRIRKENGNLTLESRLRMIEAFRGIRYHLLTMHASSEPLVLTISSPAMGEGKSITTAALALAFADLGHPTALIDGDVRRGRLHRLLGLSATPGLTEFLAGRASRDQVVQETPYPLVDLIAMGSGRADAPELLSSGAMSELLRDLTARYRVILVDSPPLSAAADSHVLSTLTGRLLLVLRLGQTDRDLARIRLQTLRDLPIDVLGVVLNDAPAEGPYQYYGYVGQNGCAEGDPAQSTKRWLVRV